VTILKNIKTFKLFTESARPPLEIAKEIVASNKKVDGELYTLISTDINSVKYLIDNGLNVNLENGLPLISAARSNNKPLVDLLLSNGAEIELNNYNVLKVLAKKGINEMLEYLINKLVVKSDLIVNNCDFYDELIKSCTESEEISGITKQKTIKLITSYQENYCNE
jgi:ankyrin repeat protein